MWQVLALLGSRCAVQVPVTSGLGGLLGGSRSQFDEFVVALAPPVARPGRVKPSN
jgi:hypothetical protein